MAVDNAAAARHRQPHSCPAGDAEAHNYWAASLGVGTDTAHEADARRAAPVGKVEADVVIVGGGFTGLWCAYYLMQARPDWSVVLLEAETVGHGASGRNGGWAIGNLAGLGRLLSGMNERERQAVIALLADNVDQIRRVLAAESIDADFHKGGILNVAARYPEQVAVQKHHLQSLLALGHSPQDCIWLDAKALAQRAHFTNGYGAVFFAQAATVHPLKLVRGLALACEKAGVHLCEHSRATTIAPGRVTTDQATVRARVVVQATEGYSGALGRLSRRVLPVQSLVVATTPLSAAIWQAIGMAERPAFCDASRVINYGHRSRDGRLIFGARGAYLFGARARHDHAITAADIDMRRRLLMSMLPALADGVDIDYGWGGSLGLSRRFRPHAIFDGKAGMATAGGYAGEGVAASHLMARTLADMITGENTPRLHMPWAHRDSPIEAVLARWEPEPLRWLSAQTISGSYGLEDALMQRGRGGWLARGVARLNDYFATLVE